MEKSSYIVRFINWLFIKPKNVQRYYDPEQHPINTDKIYKELKIELRAKELGETEQPSTSEVIFSGVENQIIQQVEKARQDYLVWTSQRLAALNHKIVRIDISVLINKANQSNHEFERKANELLNESDLLLRNLKDIAHKKNIELNDFRKKNNLVRLAVYPTKTGAFYRYSLLVLLVCFESALNSMLFAKGLSTGYIGGFMYALMFASTNVVISFLNGLFLLRYLNHNKFSRKLIGITSIILWLLLSIVIAFLTAHFRDALSMDVEDPSVLALQTLINNPFGLHDTQSWLLLLISIFFSLLSYLDGMFLKDKYPSYSDIEKRTKNALDDYQIELEDVRDNLKDLKDSALDEIEEILKSSKQNIDNLHELIQAKKALKAKIEYSLPDIEKCKNYLINEFRNQNKKYRKTGTPKYFSSPVKLEELALPDFMIEDDDEKYKNQKYIYNSLVDKVEEIRAYIQSSFNKKHDSLIPLTEHFDIIG